MSHDPPPPQGGPSGLPPGRPPRPRPGPRRPVPPPPPAPEEVTRISPAGWDEPSGRRPPTPPGGLPLPADPRPYDPPGPERPGPERRGLDRPAPDAGWNGFAPEPEPAPRGRHAPVPPEPVDTRNGYLPDPEPAPRRRYAADPDQAGEYFASGPERAARRPYAADPDQVGDNFAPDPERAPRRRYAADPGDGFVPNPEQAPRARYAADPGDAGDSFAQDAGPAPRGRYAADPGEARDRFASDAEQVAHPGYAGDVRGGFAPDVESARGRYAADSGDARSGFVPNVEPAPRRRYAPEPGDPRDGFAPDADPASRGRYTAEPGDPRNGFNPDNDPSPLGRYAPEPGDTRNGYLPDVDPVPRGPLGYRLNGEPDQGFRGDAQPRRRPVPPPDATQYTNAFSGSLPPPPAGRRPAPRPVDPPTEIIPTVRADAYQEGAYPADSVEDEYEDYEDDYYEEDDEEDEYDDVPPPKPKDSAARKTVRTVGELLITAGLVILLFVVYEVYVTDLISAGKQDDATHALDDKWGSNTVEGAEPQRQAQYDLIEGQAFAKMYIPAFGPDYKFSIVEGTSDKHLEIGPGHYVNTALPGNPGNFAVAGHRVGKGAPFNDLDLLNSCDAIVVETQTQWFVYRMLPKSGEAAGWAQSDKLKDPRCAKVAPLGGSYDKTVGQEIVAPTQGEVINAIPHFTGTAPEAQQAALMTLTTCHPRFSDRERLIVHAVLTQGYPKAPGFLPEELKEQ